MLQLGDKLSLQLEKFSFVQVVFEFNPSLQLIANRPGEELRHMTLPVFDPRNQIVQVVEVFEADVELAAFLLQIEIQLLLISTKV